MTAGNALVLVIQEGAERAGHTSSAVSRPIAYSYVVNQQTFQLNNP